MRENLRSKLSFANVTSALALFVALGGTSYAAITLPRNSVGSKQVRPGAIGASELRKNAVRSSDVKDRSLQLRDISRSARDSLRGQTGPTGPPGPSGVTFRAAVPAGGTLQRGNATSVAHQGGTNEYRVAHVPWRLASTANVTWHCDIAANYTGPLADFLTARPTSAIIAEGSSIQVFPGTQLK